MEEVTLSEEFIAAGLAGIGGTLDELIEGSPGEAVRGELAGLVGHMDCLIDRLGEPSETKVQSEEEVGEAPP